MPFKSKAQQRFMFAAEDRGDISKGTASRWAKETPNMKKLPERKKHADVFRKLAVEFGRLSALRDHGAEKTAGVWSQLARYGAPGLAGSYLAGPGYRGEGFLGGMVAGKMLGPGLAQWSGKQLGKVPGVAEAAAKRIGKGGINPQELQKAVQNAGLAGEVAAGAGGGLAAGRMLGLQNPYGLQPVFPGMPQEGRPENVMGMRPQ